MPKKHRGGSKKSSFEVVDYAGDGTWSSQKETIKAGNAAQRLEAVRAKARASYREAALEERKNAAEKAAMIDFMGGMEYGEDIEDGECLHTDSVLEQWWFKNDDDGVADGYSGDLEDEGEILEDLRLSIAQHQRKRIYNATANRNRKDAENRNWEGLYPLIEHAYSQYERLGKPEVYAEATVIVMCLDVFDYGKIGFPCSEESGIVISMARHGFFANNPLKPTLGFSLRILQLYDSLSARCGNVGIQPFIRSLLDILRVQYKASVVTAFSRAFIEIRERIKKRLDEILFPTILCKQKHACPCCASELTDEPELDFKMLVCMDGNESLKRHLQIRRFQDVNGAETIEDRTRPDSRKRMSYRYLDEGFVNIYKDEVKKRNTESTSQAIRGGSQRGRVDNEEGTPVDGGGERTSCEDKWQNLAADSKKKMWGTFDETGIFVVACRHGVVLLMCDMVRSGELAKYPLAIMSKLTDIFDGRILCGYDIGCGFSKTVRNSVLVGEKVDQGGSKIICNAFHGHAHSRICQLQWHPMYTQGAGLEDFEGCERVFSESNRVAGITRHATKFHRQQTIDRHFDRWNDDKYVELVNFILKNYKQAHASIVTCTRTLEDAKIYLETDDIESIRAWQSQELAYLKETQENTEPTEERMKLEYVELLKKFNNAKFTYESSKNLFINSGVGDFGRNVNFYTQKSQSTIQSESAMVRNLDSVLTLEGAVNAMELRLGIQERWTPDSTEWKAADISLAEREYLRAIDRLEGVAVARLFELEKANQASTGYKLRTQINKMLKMRSQALKTAVEDYNKIARRLGRQPVRLENVLSYVYLSQFDLLRLSRHKILEKPWATNLSRTAATAYHKLNHAREEIRRLDVEVLRLAKYIQSYHAHVARVMNELQLTDPDLAYMLSKQHERRRQQDIRHLERLKTEGYLFGENVIVPDISVSGGQVDVNDDEDEGSDDEDTNERIDNTLEVIGRLDS